MVNKSTWFATTWQSNASVLSIQNEHASLPAMLQPESMAKIRKSLMVHSKAARMRKFCLFSISYVSTPTFHNCFNSSIKDCKNISTLNLGLFGLETIIVRNIQFDFMHNPNERLYGVRMMGQDEYYWSDCPNGWNPSLHNPSITFLIFEPNDG